VLLLRTADAANLDADYCQSKSDLYSPNIVRSSVGCLFTNQIATGTTAEIVFQREKINLCVLCKTQLSYHTQDYTKPTALVVGTEATGLTQEWRDATSKYYNPNGEKLTVAELLAAYY
jgi:TrmH family RNA methyltransferase